MKTLLLTAALLLAVPSAPRAAVVWEGDQLIDVINDGGVYYAAFLYSYVGDEVNGRKWDVVIEAPYSTNAATWQANRLAGIQAVASQVPLQGGGFGVTITRVYFESKTVVVL